MKSVFISTKLRTTEDLDWAGPLKKYLTKIYGNTTDFTKEVGIINRLRIDLTNTIRDTTDNLKAKDVYYKYYGQLELLDLRLPIQEHGVRIKFRWHDAYNTSAYHSQHSLAFEKASVLFNLGATLGYIAAENFVDGDYKASYQYFQYAAGVYKFMSENFLHAPSQDVNGKTSLFLQHLQLGQAQEVFLLKLISEDSSKASLIAKLAASTTSHYKQALETLEKLDGDFGEAETWKHVLDFKQAFYYNLSFYFHAFSIEDKKIGEAITYLRIALDGFTALKKLDNDTTIDYKTYQTQAEDKLRLLIKDNDFIYHATIPTKESLDLETAVKPLDAAKAIPINEHPNISQIIGEDIFEKIIPSNVHERLSFYSEEKAKVLREQIENVETTDIELASFLEYLRLPSSLNDFKNSSQHKLDPKLVDYSEEVSNSRLNDIKTNNYTIGTKRQEILGAIKELESKLDNEEEEYTKARGQGIQQEPSSSQSANLRDDLTGAKQSLVSASKLDQQINEKIDPEIQVLEKLKSRQLLEAEFFNDQSESLLDLDDAPDNAIGVYVEEIEKLLRQLNDLKKERSTIIAELKQAIQDDDISNILVLNTKNLNDKDEKILFEKELTKFQPLLQKLNTNHTSQNQYIDKVKINYNKIISSNTKVTQNVQKISRYEKTFKIFKEYETNFKKSITFYSNLLSYVGEVKASVDRFVSDRNSQRERLSTSRTQSQADDISKRFNNLSVSSQSPRGSYSSQQAPQQRQQSFSSEHSFTPSYSNTASSYTQPSTTSYASSNPTQSYQQPTPNYQSPYQQQPNYGNTTPTYQRPASSHQTASSHQHTPSTPSYQQPTPPPYQAYGSYQQPTPPTQQQPNQPHYQPQYQPQQPQYFQQQQQQQSFNPQVPNYPTGTGSAAPTRQGSSTYAKQQGYTGYPGSFQSQQTPTQQSQQKASQPSYSTPYDPTRPYP